MEETLADTPVIFVNGPRQAGKTTMVREFGGGAYFTMDDAAVMGAVAADPVAVLKSGGRLIIDEVQRVPTMFPALKAEVDRDRRPGRFLLTGSANILLLPSVSESLAGRMEVLTLWPLAQAEIVGAGGNLVEKLFQGKPFSSGRMEAAGMTIEERVLAGGFPEAFSRKDPGRRAAWFAAYVSAILQRDIRDLSQIAGLTDMPRLLSLLASRTGGMVNQAELSRALGVPHTTLVRYMGLLELLFLLVRLPAWSENRGKRLVKSPKYLLSDSGLCAHLAGLDAGAFMRDRSRFGALLENFVGMELLKLGAAATFRTGLYHYRTAAGTEVDFLMEGPGGGLVAVEVKAGATITSKDFRGLRSLAEEFGERLRAGVLLYTGEEVVSFGERLTLLPVQSLWE
ncbi:MAG: ATP-binding protein [Terrimicrobiaceae bacterium]